MPILKRKKIIAREILLFFAIIVLTGLVCIFRFERNYFYENRLSSLYQNKNLTTIKIDSLPRDVIKSLYVGVKKELVVNYVLNGHEYTIPKKDEYDFLYAHSNAILQLANRNGYSIFSPINKNINNRIITFNHLVFDFVDLEQFRQLLMDPTYRNNLYNALSEYYDVGTFNLFTSKIDSGFMFTNEMAEQKQKLLKEKKRLVNLIIDTNNKIRNDGQIWQSVEWTFLLLIIAVYPLRLCYFIIKWSIITLRKKEEST